MRCGLSAAPATATSSGPRYSRDMDEFDDAIEEIDEVMRQVDDLTADLAPLLETAKTSNFDLTAYDGMQKRFQRQLTLALRAFQGGNIDVDELEQRWARSIATHYEPAYRMGSAQWPKAGVGATDQQFIKAAARSEIGFVSRFAREVGAGKMSERQIAARLDQYALGLESVKTSGWTRKAPDSTWFAWRLGVTSFHCSDCPTLAAASPFSRDQLPTRPRAGDTSCRSRCKCFLEIVDGPIPPRTVRVVTADPDVTSGRKLGGGVPSAAERARVDDLRARINYHRRRIETAPTESARMGAIQARKQANAELIDYQRARQIRDVPMLDVGEVIGRRQIEPDVIDGLVLRGIDGASLDLVDEAAWKGGVADLLQRIETLGQGG